MNWEESKACTSLKRDFLRAWFASEQRFFLTGGSALGLFYLEHRHSYDLDLFTASDVEGIEIRNLVLDVVSRIGAGCTFVKTSPGFHRYLVEREGQREIVDVILDRVPQLDSEKPVVGGIRVDTLREITANKLTTLLSRAELKDLVDLYFLHRSGLDLLAAVPDAKAKDGGWEPAVVAMLLDGFRTTEAPPWMIKEIDLSDLEQFREELRLALVHMALPTPSAEP